MPLPTPEPDESRDAFMERCMSDAADEFEDEDQRTAVCSRQWDEGQGDDALAAATSYPHIVRAVFGTAWAILPDTYALICEVVRERASGIRLSDDAIAARIAALRADPRDRTSARPRSRIAVLPLHGIVAQRMNLISAFSGGTSTEQFGRHLRGLVEDDTIDAVVLDIDSPGGSVFGVSELADVIHGLRGTKPIVAVANSIAASAAYWIASQADELVVTPSGEVGSIGVIASHMDESEALAQQGRKMTFVTAGKYKAEGVSASPLSSEAHDYLQERVNDYYGQFVHAVARGRGAATETVRSGYGQGRLVGAQTALKSGMVDRVATLEATVERLASPQARAAVLRRGTRDQHATGAPAGAQTTKGVTVDSQAREILGLAPDADDAAVLAAIKALRAKPAAESPYSAEEFRTLQGQVGTLTAELAKRDATAVVEKAIAEGKVLPAQREWAQSYAAKDLDGFKVYVAGAPTFPLGATGAQGSGDETTVNVTPKEAQFGKMLGLTEEQLAAQKRRDQEQLAVR